MCRITQKGWQRMSLIVRSTVAPTALQEVTAKGRQTLTEKPLLAEMDGRRMNGINAAGALGRQRVQGLGRGSCSANMRQSSPGNNNTEFNRERDQMEDNQLSLNANNLPRHVTSVTVSSSETRVRRQARQLKRRSRPDMYFGTWNVLSLHRPGALCELRDEVRRYKIDVLAMQEIRWLKTGTLESRDYTMFYSCSDARHEFGTGFLVSSKCKDLVMSFSAINERLCTLRLRGRWSNITFINVHAPTEEQSDDYKDSFYEKLEEVFSSVPRHDIKILLGDFNAQIGREQHLRPTIGLHSFHQVTNNNGQRAVDFADSRGLVVGSTYFPHRDIHKATWKNPRGGCTQIDHVMIDRRHFSNILDVRSFRGADCNSDHFLVRFRFRWRLAAVYSCRTARQPVFDSARLKEERVLTSYQQNLESRIQPQSLSDINSCWINLRTTVSEAACDTIGYKRRTNHNIWFDEECRAAVRKRREARLKYLTRSTRRTKLEFCRARKAATRLCRFKKRKMTEQRVREIEESGQSNDIRTFFRSTAMLRQGFQPRSNMVKSESGDLITNIQGILEEWSNHFDKLLNGTPSTEVRERCEETPIDNPQPLVSEPTYDEFMACVKKLKSNKAPGADSIPSELIKEGGPPLWNALYQLMLRVWNEEVIPDDWKESVIVPIHKKGDRTVCSNYRGISLLSSAYKVLSYIIAGRLRPYAEEILGEYQCGFRPGRSTTDQIFTVRQIMQKCWEYSIPLHHLFVDFKQAYDSVNRQALWAAMVNMGVPHKLVNLCRITVEGSTAMIRVQNKTSRKFRINKGLRQGDALSVILFNLALDFVLRKCCVRSSGTIFNKSKQVLGYADDLDLVGRSPTDIIEMIARLDDYACGMGLQINEDKTKYLTTSTRHGSRQNLTVNDWNFECVDSFKYLGTYINSTNDMTSEVRTRITQGNRAFASVRPLLRSRLLSRKSKERIYRAVIRPVVTYGSEAWVLTEENIRALSVFERRVLRSIYGGIRDENGEFRRRMNSELYDIFGSPSLVNYIKSSRLRWLGHVLRMNACRTPKAVLDGNPEGTRRRGRPRLRWSDDVERDLRMLHVANWRGRAQDRTLWRETVVEAAKTLHGW